MLEDNPTLPYLGDAGRHYHEGKRGIPESAFPWVAKLRSEKISPHVSSTDVVFEFGVGSGWNLAGLNCAERIGCDVSEFLAPALTKQNIKFLSDPSSIAPNSLDVILCHHTLEHVLHPAGALQDFRRILRPGGKLLLFVPYEKERRYRNYNRNEPNHHLYCWNVQTLGNLVEAMGFKVVECGVGRFGYDRFAAHWATRLKAGETGFRVIRQTIHLLKPAFEVRMVAMKK
ncbi:MAG: class I SAM-dependent methyltransferase [Verrucomicrobiota bacterium]